MMMVYSSSQSEFAILAISIYIAGRHDRPNSHVVAKVLCSLLIMLTRLNLLIALGSKIDALRQLF
jgi:hypothetical protein